MDNLHPSDNAIRYDEQTIQHEAQHLPEELRESYCWLKNFVAKECNRDLDLLVEKLRPLGVYIDKTNWSKVLKGRMTRDAKSRPLAYPVLAHDKFLTAVEALRTNVRAEALRGKIPFVTTTVYQSIEDYILARCATDRVNRFGIIVGHTGTQKTASFKELVLRRNHGTTRWLEAPENGAVGEFVTCLAGAFNYSRQTSVTKKKNKLYDAIKPHHCLIIDNMQDMYRDGESRQPALSFMRRLQDETGCTLILSVTPTFERKLMEGMVEGYFEQFEGRSGGRKKWLRLPEYPPEEDVLMIAKAFEFQHARQHLKTLVAIAKEPGRVRRLFEDLQEARILANAAKEPLTIEHLREARGED